MIPVQLNLLNGTTAMDVTLYVNSLAQGQRAGTVPAMEN